MAQVNKAAQRYGVTQTPIETILTWVKSNEIAIPEIQRPFVWDSTQVRDLLDSLYKGYPIGYLIAWRNPTVRLKDGTSSAGKRILIDGQQRVAALMASLLGMPILTQEYDTVRIKVSFHPTEERFEVANPAIAKDVSWLTDVADVFAPEASLVELTDSYADRNPKADRKKVSLILERLRKIVNNNVGVIELAEDLDIDTVTDIFIRVNSKGAVLSQADFAMSKIAVDERHGGPVLRKAIDYFCHLAVAPEFISRIESTDQSFARSDFFQKMRWVQNATDWIYQPAYTDMLRVAFTSRFRRGKLQDLVALLSGRNFETKQFEDAIAEESFESLKQGVMDFINQTHFERFTMILRSADFVSNDLIRAQNPLNFAYVVYLKGRAEGVAAALLESLVRRWYVMSVLTGRYSGSPETAFDDDIRQIEDVGPEHYVDTVAFGELSDSFWSTLLPQQMVTSSENPYFLVYKAAQVKTWDRGFLSSDITVRDLILNRSDVHHLYPKNYLKNMGLTRSEYNQIANYAVAQSEINIAIGDDPPAVYFAQLKDQCNGGEKKYGGIDNETEVKANLRANCIPEAILDSVPSYEDFLAERRQFMAKKMKDYFWSL
jgi:hypothetical protein